MNWFPKLKIGRANAAEQGYAAIEIKSQQAEIERLQDENGQLLLWKDAAIREYPPIAKELADYQKTPREKAAETKEEYHG